MKIDAVQTNFWCPNKVRQLQTQGQTFCNQYLMFKLFTTEFNFFEGSPSIVALFLVLFLSLIYTELFLHEGFLLILPTGSQLIFLRITVLSLDQTFSLTDNLSRLYSSFLPLRGADGQHEFACLVLQIQCWPFSKAFGKRMMWLRECFKKPACHQFRNFQG